MNAAASPGGGFAARRSASPEAFLDAWARPGTGCAVTPFQSEAWLGQWFAHLGRLDGIEPVFIEVHAADGAPAYALPLIRDTRGPRAVIGFADLGVSDYNFPLLGPAAPATRADAQSAWQAARAALPRADLCRFEKMPATFHGRDNPLLLALDGQASHLFGSYVTPGDDYEGWLYSLGKHHRKELARFWRVFTRSADARFVHAKSRADAAPILAWIEAAQRARGSELGYDYLLDAPGYRDLYRDLLAEGLESGAVIVTALMAGDEIVAALYGVADGTHYAMVRIATAGGDWANCSPGRLIIERSIAALHVEGYRWFDFTIGDYAYKRRFETSSTPLFDVTLARSLRGLPESALAQAKAYVKRNPALERMARRALSLRPGAIKQPERHAESG